RLAPSLAAIAGLEYASLGVRSPEMPERRHVSHIRIPRVDHDSVDVHRIRETAVRPGFARVGGLVDAVAPGRALPVVRLAGAHVDDVGIRWRNGDIADRAGRLIVEDGLPGRAAVGRLEDPA